MQTKRTDLGVFSRSSAWMNFANDMILIQSDKRVRACGGGLLCNYVLTISTEIVANTVPLLARLVNRRMAEFDMKR